MCGRRESLRAKELKALGWCPNDVWMVLESFSKGFRMGEETDNILSISRTGGTGGGTKWRDKTEVCGIQEP